MSQIGQAEEEMEWVSGSLF
uniref:Uncharacterized protein n=1 Tax=Rhizophora mucronata TaxID=61149 RepID=A0A2P2QAY4_RHIMU